MRVYHVKDFEEFIKEAIAWKLSHTIKSENETHLFPEYIMHTQFNGIDFDEIFQLYMEEVGLYEILDLGAVYETVDEIIQGYLEMVPEEEEDDL